ncbi:hypothetical protein GOP47_0016085 [Adiantum capillus-veneris]|uniref:Uncharacterized protein n=1 Tax=Adiantum capillus-veneris TaxID=13818 RepID=A0A9D4UKW5_ADICA|nr:hypothetical protein GOP47_0016085 [Adiantum capillus-veneris]
MGAGNLLALVARVQSFRMKNTAPLQLTASAGAGDVQLLMGSFHADLAQRVGQLQLQGGSAHLNWLLDACACTLSTHSALASALKNAHATPPANQRADEMLSLLDACTSLKQMADDVDRQLGSLQAALIQSARGLQASRAAGRLAAARRLRPCLDGLQSLSSAQYRPIKEAQAALLLAAKRELLAPASNCRRDPAAQTLHHALDGTLLISLLVLASAIATFAPPLKSSSGAVRSACKIVASSCKSGSSLATVTMWGGPLWQLQRDLKQEDMSALFFELQGLHSAAASIYATVSGPAHADQATTADLRQRIDSMHKRSQEARACVTALRSQLASLFQALVALRLSLLALP